MQSYMVNWAFLLDYDKNSDTVNVKFSKQFIKDNELAYVELSLLSHEICSFLHRYDCRKLSYFCQTDMESVFDTLMRFTIKKSKYPLRTIALCKRTEHGLSCINFEESKLFGLRKLNRASQSKKIVKQISISNATDLSDDHHHILVTIEKHLAKIIEREQVRV